MPYALKDVAHNVWNHYTEPILKKGAMAYRMLLFTLVLAVFAAIAVTYVLFTANRTSDLERDTRQDAPPDGYRVIGVTEYDSETGVVSPKLVSPQQPS